MRLKLTIATAALLMGLAGFASAQETYSFSLAGTAANKATYVGRVNLGRLQSNADVCSRASLPATCTQAQACTALGVTGGASCTATDALAANARIYPDTEAGRGSFIANEMVKKMVAAYYQEQITRDKATLPAVCSTANAATITAICASVGLPSDCLICAQ